MRTAARIDANQNEIVEFLRKAGASVLIVSSLKNCCDLFVGYRGLTCAVEIKDGGKVPSRRQLTEGEEKFRDTWRGDWALVESVEDAHNLLISLVPTSAPGPRLRQCGSRR